MKHRRRTPAWTALPLVLSLGACGVTPVVSLAPAQHLPPAMWTVQPRPNPPVTDADDRALFSWVADVLAWGQAGWDALTAAHSAYEGEAKP